MHTKISFTLEWFHPNGYPVSLLKVRIHPVSNLFNIPVALLLMCAISSLATNISLPHLSSGSAMTLQRENDRIE